MLALISHLPSSPKGRGRVIEVIDYVEYGRAVYTSHCRQRAYHDTRISYYWFQSPAYGVTILERYKEQP